MSKQKKVLIGKMACVLGLIPMLIYAYEYGPDPGFTGAPGDNKTACIASGCHVGTVNQFSGSVKITSSAGTSYTPGVAQHITVTVTDPSQKGAGFEATARLASEAGKSSGFTQPGSFTVTSSQTQVICADTSLPPCRGNAALQYVEHNLSGWSASRNAGTSYAYTFDWTPPVTDSGSIILYAAGNASPDGTTNNNTGHIYTTSLTLTSAGAGTTPQISSSDGVTNGATFTSGPLAPNTYITIKGTNLAPNMRQWGGSDFTNNGTGLPTALDGVSVSVNGKPAYVEFISSTQINAITPADTATGSGLNVTVTSRGQTSTAATVTYQSVSPGFFTFDGKYVAAADALTGAFIGAQGLFSSAPNLTTPAKPGQVVTLYGTGFGPTTPALAAGIITDRSQFYNLTAIPVMNLGGTAITPSFAGLAPGFAQVYQLNIQIPSNAPNGDLAIFATVGGVTTPNNSSCCFITVHN